jgi:hypothetical protein
MTTTWRRSSHSGANGNNDCVEVDNSLAQVRDSKNNGSSLCGDVAALVAAVKAGRFDR